MPKTAFVYTDDYANFRYSDSHPLKPYRLRLTRDLIHSYGLLDLPQSRVVETVAADRNTLQRFHAPDYVRVLEAAEAGTFHPEFAPYGFGPGDNPVFAGVYTWSQLCVGGTLQAARLVESGEVDIAFHIAGGLHHALARRASGFCYVNDPVIAMRELVDKGHRVAYVDIDVHHGDGVQTAFYDTDHVLTISLHESGHYLFPGTGFAHEMGTGAGHGYAVNLPLPPGIDDESYYDAFMAIVPPLLRAYAPDIVFTQLGVDTFRDDPLAHAQLTTAGFLRVLEVLKACAPRWIATGGGGYNLPNVARGWTLAWGVMNDVDIPNALPTSAVEALQQEGYSGKTLRDPEVLWHPSHRDSVQSEVEQALSYLKTHVFPIHGLT